MSATIDYVTRGGVGTLYFRRFGRPVLVMYLLRSDFRTVANRLKRFLFLLRLLNEVDRPLFCYLRASEFIGLKDLREVSGLVTLSIHNEVSGAVVLAATGFTSSFLRKCVVWKRGYAMLTRKLRPMNDTREFCYINGLLLRVTLTYVRLAG